MRHVLAAGSLGIALLCVCVAPAYARGHGHGRRSGARGHAHHAAELVSGFRTRVIVAPVEHRAAAHGACGYERAVCAEECRLVSATICERCNQDVARCERAAY